MQPRVSDTMWKDVPETDWNNWKWQMRHRVCTHGELARAITLTRDEEAGIRREEDRLPMAITPHFLSLIDPDNPECPLRRQVVPRIEEHFLCSLDMEDPCG